MQMPFDLLDGCRIVDLSTEIAGPYATKLLVDAGAEVVKVEPEGGDPLRRWTASKADLHGNDGALFRFLNSGKRSVVGVPTEPGVRALLAGSDVVIESGRLPLAEIDAIRATHPRLSVISISPYGRRGPWADRPATEFTLQAECGAMATRGLPEREPIQVGGRVGEYVTGVYAAIAAVSAAHRSRRSGTGEHVDVSMFECMCSCMGGMSPLSRTLGGVIRHGPARNREMPSIEPTADGYVGICCNTGQQFQDLLRMLGREDLVDDHELASFPGRWARRDEFWEIIHAWTRKRTSAEIVELANRWRIPCVAVVSPEDLTEVDHFVAREIYGLSPDADFVVPRVPYQVDGRVARPDAPAPAVDEHAGVAGWAPGSRDAPDRGKTESGAVLPFEGIRVLDFTSFWAGPCATQMLAALGADVIHIESVQHPDGYRFISLRTTDLPELWWERSVGFQQENWNKRGITLNVADDDGRELLLRLVEHADAFVENYSPRVLDNFGITAGVLRERNPSAVVMRMPAFGLTGPWRDRTAFASTIEAASGLAWNTGYADGPPTTLRGPLDPISGMHASFALIAALYERHESGSGHFIEAPMIEPAVNIAAELVIELSAYDATLLRDGNRGPNAAPQGVYPCRGEEQWLALAVADDDQWAALCKAMGAPDWATLHCFGTAEGRRRADAEIDRHIREWARELTLDEAVNLLLDHGVPAGAVVDGLELLENEQLRFRHYYETIDTPLLGHHLVRSLPFRFASRNEPWIRSAAPTLGEHTRGVLAELLELGTEDMDRLEAGGIIGTRPAGLEQ